MFNPTKILLALLAAGTLAACSATDFEWTWKAPGVAPAELHGQKVAAFVLNPNESIRRAGEEAAARALTRRGVRGVAGYTLLPGDVVKDKEGAKKKLQAAGFDAVITLRVIAKEQKLTWESTAMYGDPFYGSFGGYWGGGWGTVYDPGYLRSDTVVSVETLIYSLESEKLVWAGLSQTFNPTDIASFIEDLAGALGKELRKSGLVR